MKTKRLITTAMLIAIGTVLSLIQIIKLPFGGSVTLATMAPIVIAGYMYGVKWGLTTGFVYALIQMLTGMDTVSSFFLPGESQMLIPHAISICIIDYVLAFSVLGFSGIFKGKFKNSSIEICLGTIVATVLRYIMHIISGVIFFGSWASWFFGDETGLSQIGAFKGFCDWVLNNLSPAMMSVVYSLVYNGCYMLPEIIITAIVAPLIFKAIRKTTNI